MYRSPSSDWIGFSMLMEPLNLHRISGLFISGEGSKWLYSPFHRGAPGLSWGKSFGLASRAESLCSQ